MITSILYKATPAEVKFIFIDPKRLELGMYADIPHLLTPIVTDAKAAANTLIWGVHEMEERYKLLARYAVKDIESFNKLVQENEELEPLPFIVIVIDELADLMMRDARRPRSRSSAWPRRRTAACPMSHRHISPVFTRPTPPGARPTPRSPGFITSITGTSGSWPATTRR
jgi:hypothetical protein